ncbi:MAG: DNA polymerase III subunit delta [Clostridiales bacterium]|nr:DNA polymerase III subunit delta [Clostridiales bacterium]
MPPKRDKVDNTAMRELKRALKEGAPKKLYVFHGEEAFLRDYYLGQLKRAILPDGLEDFNLHTARGKDCSVDWIEQAVDCLPMMSERTLVAVTDFDLFAQGDKGKEKLLSVLEALPDYCCLVFVYDLLPYKADGRSKLAALLKKEGAVVNFQRQEQGDLTDWICRQFKKAGKSVDTEDARYLIFLVGDLMHDLASEIGKLTAYAGHPRVTRADMDAVVIPKLDAVVFQMTDAMARKDFDKAASVLADLLHSQQAPIMILAAMGKYFRQLYTARLYLDAGKGREEFMELWGMKSAYPADKLMDAARRFSLPWCRYAVRRCAETDIVLKSSYGQENEVLTALLMELASGRRATV